ncbi:P-loop containing nucleoside triphosphate hydrolase protein [Gautieria morchelliformis]|nr:P-loop containing nucleoside triphosphate hydrolase protein [Gautieria morchelliformis]
MVPNQPDKTKTKAKQRYLKVKRDRRKKKKATQALPTNIKNKLKIEKSQGEQNSDYKDEDHSDVESSDAETFGNDSLMPPVPLPSMLVDARAERPRKRRKVVDETQDVGSLVVPALSASREASPSGKVPVVDDILLGRQTPAMVPLTAFPMPSTPAVTSQKALALQGLDPGLIDAETIDLARTISIDSSDTNRLGASSNLGLSPKTQKRLKELGITDFFAVQSALIPFLLPSSPYQRALYTPYNATRDVCVSAPTGSGKTLAYVIPILELLSTRIVTRLRALVVLPTRDLVTQVRETFEALCKGRGLKIAVATGQHSFTHEQAQLIEELTVPLQGGSSKVDILICTPGRLIDHIKGTMNFSLQHLRFLVIDEADRLLTQSFQDWLAQVLAAIRPPMASIPPSRSHVDENRESSCQKLLFSATLTRDPAKISALDLRDAKYFVVKDTTRDDQESDHLMAAETFVFPATLNEHMIVCSTYQKPLILFYMVHKHGVRSALVFTKSAESTNRLVRLFECFENAKGSGSGRPVAHAYSSDLSSAERRSILEKFKSQEIDILVCSDLISRGIDISHVSHVVSYDAPVDMRKYVHRVGRTARAGRVGDAWSLIEKHEVRGRLS